MYSGRFRGIWRTATFRVILWSSAIFIVSSALLFVLSYLLLVGSLETKDRLAIQFLQSAYDEEFSEGGSAALRARVEADRASGKLRDAVVRLLDAGGSQVWVSAPAGGPAFDLSLPAASDSTAGGWASRHAPGTDTEMDLLSTRLANGWTIQVGLSREQRDDVLRRYRDTIIVLLVVIIAVGFAGGVVLAYRALRPARALMSSLQPIIETGELRARVPVEPTGDEFEELSVLLNRALERIDHVVASMRGSLDNVAHDLRTPMTRLRGIAELALASGATEADHREALSNCLEESANMLIMLDTLLEISEVEAGSIDLALAPLDLAPVLSRIADMYGMLAEHAGITLELASCEPLVIVADRSRMTQAVANLVDNAVKYTPPGGQVCLEAHREDGDAVIVVRDSGIGIPAHEAERIWDRSFRGDASRSKHGLGLGLSVVRAVARAHGGSVTMLSSPGAGARFTLRLPLAPRPRD